MLLLYLMTYYLGGAKATRFYEESMKKSYAALFLAALMLAACGRDGSDPAAETDSFSTGTAASAVTSAPTATQELPTPSDPPTGPLDAPVSASAEQANVVRPGDWVVGPDDAAVTLVEYGDFQ
jgi:hypothetical protein